MFYDNSVTEEQLRREDLERKLARVTCRFEHVQFDAESGGGWVPQESVNSDPQNNDDDVASQPSAQNRDGLVRRIESTAPKATVNRTGEQRISTSGYGDCKSKLLNLSAKLVAEAKRNFKSTYNALISATHKSPEKRVTWTGPVMNADAKFDLEKVKRLHTENTLNHFEDNTTNRLLKLQALYNQFSA